MHLLPKDWSADKIRKVTGAFFWLISKIKNNSGGANSLIVPKKSGKRSLSIEEVRTITNFYEDDENSRQLPGMKDYITVKMEDGSKVKVQKRLVLYNLRELFGKFKELLPEFKIGFSKFACLRPKH